MQLPVNLIPPAQPKQGEVWLGLLDAGQGLATVIRTKNSVLVYDTGPKYCSGFNTGETVIIAFLRAKGIKKIDKLVISHGDNDHSCVLKVSATGGTILLPGDIEKRSEKYLVAHANKQLNSDILIVPHHMANFRKGGG